MHLLVLCLTINSNNWSTWGDHSDDGDGDVDPDWVVDEDAEESQDGEVVALTPAWDWNDLTQFLGIRLYFFKPALES